MMTTPGDLSALLAAATPGPWAVSLDDLSDVVLWGPNDKWIANVGMWGANPTPDTEVAADARALVALRNLASLFERLWRAADVEQTTLLAFMADRRSRTRAAALGLAAGHVLDVLDDLAAADIGEVRT